jgi:hypothetical protein
LVGGLYGVHIGGGFFGESMFGLEPNVSKLSFCILCRILIENGFILGANLKENFSGSIYTRTGIDLYNLFIVSSSKNMKTFAYEK